VRLVNLSTLEARQSKPLKKKESEWF